MRIMIISHSFGEDASGMVVESMANALAERNTVDLYTINYKPSVTPIVNKVEQYKYPIYGVAYTKYLSLSIRLFGKDLLSHFVISSIINDIKGIKYDIVLSFIYGFYYIGALAGNKVKEKLQIPHFSYFIDPIPAPEGWLKPNMFYRRLKTYTRDFSQKIDKIALSNFKMVEYQKTIIDHNNMSVLYTPTRNSKLLDLPRENDGIKRFLYTGTIYGLRNPKFLLKAFEKLISKGVNAELLFVGTAGLSIYLEDMSEEARRCVKIYPRTNDLMQYYKISDVLLDIDANIPDDVFMSSKIINYLSVPKPIISQTRENSPSDQTFRHCNTILQARFSVNSMYETMLTSIDDDYIYNYDERNILLNQFDVNTISKQLENYLSLMVEDNETYDCVSYNRDFKS